ncbi:MAG: S8 family serine peptidase [Pyrinomonadaceae bacterium]|nr:S8 family serine peptidase [Phycisphaerales bacterium]
MHLKKFVIPAMLVVLAGSTCAVARVDHEDPKQHTRRALAANPKAQWDPEVILVRFKAGASDQAKASMMSLVGGTSIEQFWLVPGLETVKVTGDIFQSIDLLSLFPSLIEYAEPDYMVHTFVTPNDPSYGQLWGMHNTGQTVNGDPGITNADINAPQAWDAFTGDANFVIADIDTGVNYNHADLSANSWINPGEVAGNGIDDDGNGYVDDTRGWDFVNNENNPMDDNGHGTHTAGTVGARGNNGIGVVGVNWQCKLMALKFLNSSGNGSTSGGLSALQYAVAKNVKVSNNSWGGGGFSQSMLNAINASQSIGHLFVAAAGNAGSNNDSSPSYPASYTAANVIAVAATNNNDGIASFSNYGATSVDIGAPGVTIYSTYGSAYAYLNGTSMACPHVAGCAALIYGYNPGWTWTQVKSSLMSTARPVSALAGRCVTGGVVNIQAAIGPGGPPTPPMAPSNLNAFENGYGNARITWTDNSINEVTFGIDRQKRSGGVWGTNAAFSAAANATSFQQVSGGGIWRYQIRAVNVAGNSAWTGYIVVQPQQPTALQNTDLVGNVVTMSWVDSSTMEEGYRIVRERFVSGAWGSATTLQVGINNVSIVDTVPGPGVYRYHVQAYAETRSSAFSPWVEVYVE